MIIDCADCRMQHTEACDDCVVTALMGPGGVLELADADRLGFIYDVGHAQAMDRLGFFSHIGWLERFSHRMFGTHLHDVIGIDDHHPPGRGEIDFKMIAPYLPDDVFRTCEIMGHHSFEQIRNGLKILDRDGCILQSE